MLHITRSVSLNAPTVTIQLSLNTPAKAKKALPSPQTQPGPQGRLTYD
jgi:hypothetical protein